MSPDARATRHLDRELILKKARAIADLDGVEALTLRRLGQELGVDSTAMYRHFRNKADLTRALIDQVFFEVPKPPEAGSWRENLRGVVHAWWLIYRRHAALAAVMAAQPDDEPRLFHLTEWTVRELQRAGVPDEELGLYHQSIYNFAVGQGLVSAFSPWLTTTSLREEQRRIYAALDPKEFPSSRAAATTIYPETEIAFLFSLELLLDAIELRTKP